MKHLLGASIGLAFLLALSGAALADITIATVGPMTGDNASTGAQFKNGVGLAVDDLNAKGGVLGQKVQWTSEDDACDPKTAVSAAELVAGKGVAAVIGHYCSGSSIPASAVYADAKILQISPGSTNPKYTDERPGPGTFRVCGRDDAQGTVAGNYIAQNFAGKKVAILNDKSAYGLGLATETQKALNAAGMKETIFDSYNADDKDFSPIVSKLKDAGIDVLYVGGYRAQAALFARQMHDQGMKVQLLGGDDLVANEFWTAAGDAGQGTMMTFAPDPTKIPAAASVVAEFKAKNLDPAGYSLYAYAAVQVWAEAATKAGSTDFDKVVAAMNSETFDTVLGPIKFDAKGDVVGAKFVWYVWKDGNYSEMAM
jgi:branched-chain amino acid transport system substrate-binding protein